MSTHNIGFYEDLTKIIFQSSTQLISSFGIPCYLSMLFTHCHFDHEFLAHLMLGTAFKCVCSCSLPFINTIHVVITILNFM